MKMWMYFYMVAWLYVVQGTARGKEVVNNFE
jgi:hypothetical protein